MIGDTLTLTRDGTSLVLSKINQDSYGAEYLLRDALQSHTVLIRHQKESPAKATGIQYERHNVQYTRTVYATATAAEFVETTSATMRLKIGADPVSLQKSTTALLAWLTAANVTKVIGWES